MRTTYRLKHPEINRKATQKWRDKNRLEFRMSCSKSKYDIRMRLINLLGGECVRCGFRDVKALQFDHINGGGSKIRSIGGGHYTIWRNYLKDPVKANLEIQILCANCNWIKRYDKKEVRKHDYL